MEYTDLHVSLTMTNGLEIAELKEECIPILFQRFIHTAFKVL